MNENFILCLGGGVYQKHLIEEIKKIKNCKPVVVDADSSCICFNEVRLKINLDINNTDLILKKLKDLKIKKKNIIAVMTQAARSAPRQASVLSKKLNCKSLNVNTAKLLENKYLLSKMFNKLLNPKKYKKIYDLKKRSYPYLIKLNNTSGGTGIKKIRKKKDFDHYFNTTKNSSFYVEQFIKSKSFNIIGLKLDKKIKYYGIFEKKINNNFSTRCIFYSKENYTNYLHILDFCNKVLKKINFDHGPFNFEIFEDNKKNLYVAEIEPSLLGGNIAKYLCYEASRENIVKDYLSYFLNLRIKFSLIFKKKYLSMHYFYSQQEYKKFLSHLKKKKITYKIIKKINLLKYKKKGLAKHLLFINFRKIENFNRYINLLN